MLQAHLLGTFAVELDGVAIAPPASRRAWDVLAWLALHPGPQPRATIASTFWPDTPDPRARANLRSALWAINTALGSNLLRAGRHDVCLDVDTDLAHFEMAVREHDLEKAAQATGEFLTGSGDDWAISARAEHIRDLVGVLEELASASEGLPRSVELTRRQVVLDPLAEEPQRRLMRRLASCGEAADALASYERFRTRLQRELGAVPSSETRRLAEQVRSGGRLQTAAAPIAMPALVGRADELRRLRGAWHAARSGHGGLVTITGPPGIGKTRLALELLHRAEAEGARTAMRTAVDLDGAAPLSMWADVISQLSEQIGQPPAEAAWPSVLTPLVPDLVPRFGLVPRRITRAAPHLERARLFEATIAMLDWACERPVLLVLDDTHVADSASLDLAGYLAPRAARRPLLIVMTRRPLPHRTQVDVLEHKLRARGVLQAELVLRPLRPAEVAELAREQGLLQSTAVDHVVASAEGNALLAVEWARTLARGEDEPPPTLRGLVRSALATLDVDALKLARFAAVAGRAMERVEVVALPVADAIDAASRALESGLLVARAGRVGYRHALLREAAYAEIPEPELLRMHEQFAGVLSDQVARAPMLSAEIARHMRRAGRDELAVEALVQAANHAKTVAALAEATDFLTEAVAIAPDNTDLLVDLAEAHAWQGQLEPSEKAFEQAIQAIPSGAWAQIADAWTRRAQWARGVLCDPKLVLDSTRRVLDALDAAGDRTSRRGIQALALAAWAEAVAGDNEQADRLLAEAHSLTGEDLHDDLIAHLIGHARAFSLVRRGRYADSYPPEIAAAAAADRLGRPDLSYGCWGNAAAAAACAGDFTRALDFVDRGMASLEGSGLAVIEVQYLAARAHILARLGRREEARVASEQQRGLTDRLDLPALRATSEHDRGLIALSLGEYGHAALLLRAALEHEAQASRPHTLLAFAEALVRVGKLDEAEDALRHAVLEPLRPADQPAAMVPRLTWLQGLIAAGRGDIRLATQRLRESAAGWRRLADRPVAGDEYVAVLVDFGRPPVAGLIEPAHELARVESDLAKLET